MVEELSLEADAPEVRPYRDGDEAEILRLFEKVFGIRRPPEHWKWKFRDNPAGRQILVATTRAEGIVGQYAGVPVWAEADGVPLLLSQIVDVMVDPSHRAQRAFKRPALFATLARAFFREFGGPDRTALLYGFPTPAHFRLGVRYLDYVPLAPVTWLAKDLTAATPLSPGRAWRTSVAERTHFDSTADRFWQWAREGARIATRRDARYLNWRYVECPDLRYRVFVAADRLTRKMRGFAVLRLGWFGQPLAALADWLVPADAPAVGRALLARCEAVARQAEMRHLHAWFPPRSEAARLLRTCGYGEQPTDYHLVYMTFTDALHGPRLAEQWYYTMGDSDIF